LVFARYLRIRGQQNRGLILGQVKMGEEKKRGASAFIGL
jgi:hypothetical protein